MDMRRESDKGLAQHSHPSHALYRQFFENAPYGLFIAQPDKLGAIHFPLINDNASALMNAGMHCEYPDYATGLKFIIKAITAQAHDAHQAAPLEREDKLLLNGQEQRIRTRLTPIYDDTGTLSSIIGVIDDISLHRSREYLASMREAEFRTTAERMGTGIVRFDPDCRRIYANTYVALAYGMKLSELIGKRPSELPGGKSGEQYEASIREVFKTGHYVEYNHDIKTKAGNAICRIMLFPEWLPNGEVGSVLGIGQTDNDSTSKLKLLPDAKELEALAVKSSNVILCFSRNGRCTYLNNAADQLLQESGLLLQAASLQNSKHPFIAATHTAIQQLLETGEAPEKELAWVIADGRRFHYRVRYLPKRSVQGEIVSIFVIACQLDPSGSYTDPLKLNPAAQHEAGREAERRRIALEIHDELGQLLTALRFRLAMLRPQWEAGDRLLEKGMQEIMDIIDRGSQEVKRITTNARPLQFGMGLKTALTDLIGDFASHTGIDFGLKLEEQECSLDETRATAIFRIVQESITNIARHSGATKASLSLSRKQDHYHLEIADNGSGFDLSAQRQKSFGLTGIRERVMLLKGNFLIESMPGQGTSLHITVPAQG